MLGLKFDGSRAIGSLQKFKDELKVKAAAESRRRLLGVGSQENLFQLLVDTIEKLVGMLTSGFGTNGIPANALDALLKDKWESTATSPLGERDEVVCVYVRENGLAI